MMTQGIFSSRKADDDSMPSAKVAKNDFYDYVCHEGNRAYVLLHGGWLLSSVVREIEKETAHSAVPDAGKPTY